MNRLRSESGFTLVELLTGMAVAMIVSLATFSLIEVVMKRSGEVGSRVETTAASRTAMDQITRQLRSQVCAKRKTMGTPRSIDAASPTSFTVFTDFTNENYGGGSMPAPDRRTVRWDAGTPSTQPTLVETTIKGVRDNSDNTASWSGTGTSRLLASNVIATQFAGGDKAKPVFFKYYRFPTEDELAANVARQPNIPILAEGVYRDLTTAELESVAKIEVFFEVLPRNGLASAGTAIQNEIYVRTADPNAQTPKPTCLTF